MNWWSKLHTKKSSGNTPLVSQQASCPGRPALLYRVDGFCCSHSDALGRATAEKQTQHKTTSRLLIHQEVNQHGLGGVSHRFTFHLQSHTPKINTQQLKGIKGIKQVRLDSLGPTEDLPSKSDISSGSCVITEPSSGGRFSHLFTFSFFAAHCTRYSNRRPLVS